MMGLFFAALGTGIIVFECLLGLRKKYPASPLGRVKTWLSAHVWLGLLSFLLILMHSGFPLGTRAGGGADVDSSPSILASGIFGVALQNYIPRRMTELVTRETIFEQIPTVIRGLRDGGRRARRVHHRRSRDGGGRRRSSCAPAA